MERKKAAVASLPVEMLANIHGRLSLLDRLAFAAVFRASRDAFKPEPPCLVQTGDAPETATLFSLAERHATTLRGPGPQHAILGSSCSGWLVTADDRAWLWLVNPVTGDRRALPAIHTIPGLYAHRRRQEFTLQVTRFLRGPPPYPYRSLTVRAEELRHSLYRKVLLSDTTDVAMLITGTHYGAVAFAMAGDDAWRMPPPPSPPRDGIEPVTTSEGGSSSWRLHSRNGVEDAVHHDGRFYSITYSGQLEAWEECDAYTRDVFTSTVIAPRLPLPADPDHRKYLVAAPGGRLMVVLKQSDKVTHRLTFKVLVLDAGAKQWKEMHDIGDTALFVGVNGSLCVPTREHPELKAGCVYYYNQDDPGACNSSYNYNGVGVFSLKDGIGQYRILGQYRSWPPPAWFMPSIP
ncbi:hypothetical protein ACQJBY_013166 [Aegilops geniculata]